MTADPCPLWAVLGTLALDLPRVPSPHQSHSYLGPGQLAFSASAAPGFLFVGAHDVADFVAKHLTFCLRASSFEERKPRELRDI